MQNITGTLMSEDTPIATIKNSIITESNETLLPLYLKRIKDFEGWLSFRAIDPGRANGRLLKKALRLWNRSDVWTALAVNAATLTDRYWFKPEGSTATYEDIRFKENRFAELALHGDPDSFSQRPSRTPELTNTGSFEKCWKLIDGKWWMYKSENANEMFSELFICKLGEKLGLPMAHYELDGKYIRSVDFTDGATVNFESMRSIMDDDADYENCFTALNNLSPEFARQYLVLIWLDTVCCNIDRHTDNFGLLREVKTGKILSVAPNFDNNTALIANGYPKSTKRVDDKLIRLFCKLIQTNEKASKMFRELELPEITESKIYECMDEIPIEVDRDFIRDFILNGQSVIREIIEADEEMHEDISSKIML